ncbi:MAG: triple tyrosine motif-containing protein, partial [Duganella sp.]
RFQRTLDIAGNPRASPDPSLVQAIGEALWVADRFGGVSVFEHGKVRHYGLADGLPQRTVFYVDQTRDATVWLGGSTGLFYRQGERWQHVEPDDGLPAGRVQRFTALPDGTLLVYTGVGLYRTIPGTRRFRLVLGQADIESGVLRRDGKVLLTTVQHLISVYDPATDAVTPLPLPAGSPIPLAIELDANDGLWLNSERGMQQLGPDLRPLRTFASPYRFSGALIYATLIDREGNSWYTTEKGVDFIRPARLNTVSLPGRMFGGLSVVAAGDGKIWIGNTVNTDNYYDATIALDSAGRRSTIGLHGVSATTRAPDGSVWLGNGNEVWHQQGERSRRWPLPAFLRGRWLQALAVGAGGRLWVSVAGRGVGTLTDGVWAPGGGHPALADSPAVSLHADARGRVWFGYPGSRIAMLDGDTIRRFDGRDGVEVGNVLSFGGLGDRLWIGGSAGVARLQGQRFTRVKAADGLPLHSVSGLVETAAGELWLQGADGLVRIGAAALAAAAPGGAVEVERFDYLDGHEGAPADVRPLASLTQAADGRLWYATTGSVGWIDPGRIVRNPVAPTPLVTGLKTGQRTFPASPGLRLPEQTDNLQIDFTAAALSIPERVKFRYRLEGLDSTWREAGGMRQAYYTNLGPGDYRFEVLAANEDGVWSRAPATLAFHISPSITQTSWFKFACGAAVLVLLYLLYLARLAQMTARIAERHRERALERDRIARTLHDTFLQSVQALILRVDLIKHKLPDDSPAHGQIDAALDTAQHVVDEGREQMLDLRVSDAHQIELGEALREFGSALAVQGGFACTLTVTGTPRRLRAAVRAEALAIGKEALTNAARHACCAAVAVELGYSVKHLRLTVRDDGKGMDDIVVRAGRRPGHWGLDGMRERALRVGAVLTVDSHAGAGCTVTFTLSGRKAYD